MPNQATIIEARDLQKFYGNFQALKDVNLDIHEGDRVVICGPSGSGKSTLLRCFNGLETHSAGRLIVRGTKLHEDMNGIEKLRQDVGMVFQQFNLFPHLTVLENLTLGPIRVLGMSTEDAEKTARQFLVRVHIPEQADKHPGQLSGGQQQRVAIARSLCMSPEIMLFDEPTSALDPEMINEVLDVMAELTDLGITMVCVTHEMGFARKFANRVVFMDGGEIIEHAEPEQFFFNPSTDRCRIFLEQILSH